MEVNTQEMLHMRTPAVSRKEPFTIWKDWNKNSFPDIKISAEVNKFLTPGPKKKKK